MGLFIAFRLVNGKIWFSFRYGIVLVLFLRVLGLLYIKVLGFVSEFMNSSFNNEQLEFIVWLDVLVLVLSSCRFK